MNYKIITQELHIEGENSMDIFTNKCNKLIKDGWEPYASVSIERTWYSDQSGKFHISQAFIQTNKNLIIEYQVITGREIDKDVTLLLYKGWKLYGNLVSVPLARNCNMAFCQICVRELNIPELKPLIDFTDYSVV